MAANRRVYDSRGLQADCQEPGSAPEPGARQSSMGYLYLFLGSVRNRTVSYPLLSERHTLAGTHFQCMGAHDSAPDGLTICPTVFARPTHTQTDTQTTLRVTYVTPGRTVHTLASFGVDAPLYKPLFAEKSVAAQKHSP